MKNAKYTYSMTVEAYEIDFYGYDNTIVAKNGDDTISFFDGLVIENEDEFIAEVRYVANDHLLQDMNRKGMF